VEVFSVKPIKEVGDGRVARISLTPRQPENVREVCDFISGAMCQDATCEVGFDVDRTATTD
jgi:hypothetical protein